MAILKICIFLKEVESMLTQLWLFELRSALFYFSVFMCNKILLNLSTDLFFQPQSS